MPTIQAQRAGGAASARKQKAAALHAYYANPRVCKQCEKVIKVREGEKPVDVRRRKFCDSTCAAIYNNHKRSALRRLSGQKTCKRCGVDMFGLPLPARNRVNCPNCRETYPGEHKTNQWFTELSGKRKVDLLNRRQLGLHANRVLERAGVKKFCVVCTYDTHVEAAHIQPVRSFPKSAYVHEINSIDNLVFLCKNHHWEFDHGIISLDKLLGTLANQFINW